MIMERTLEQAGLTRIESKIYLSLLDLGPSLAGMISRKSGVHRRSVYDAVERLIQKGLVSYIVRNNRKYFEAADPQSVLQFMRRKENDLTEKLPLLTAKYNATKEKQETTFYKGKNGLKSVFEDELNVGEEILILGASSRATEILAYYFHWFDKRRVAKKIPVRLIYNQSKRIKHNIKLAKIKYLPSEYENPAAMNMYGDRVAIIHWSKERPFAILIRDREIAEGYKKYFELMWKIAKR